MDEIAEVWGQGREAEITLLSLSVSKSQCKKKKV